MKARVLVLVGSAAINAALVGFLTARPWLAPAALHPLLTRAPAPEQGAARQNVTARPISPASTAADPAIPLWTALHSPDLATFVQRLRAAGFPPAMVRAIVDAEVERQFSPRIKELVRNMTETPYWRADSGMFGVNTKLQEQVNQIYRERTRALRDLLGKDAQAWGGDTSALQRRQFGDLSPAKIELVQRINEDYAEMIGQVRSGMQGIALPEDREKLALLEREKRADLAAVLTPEEFADYEMRSSPITMRLTGALSIMDANEAEFRAIYAAHSAHRDTLYPASAGGMNVITREMSEQRRDATLRINESLRPVLGEQRFAEYQRATDMDFQQLYRLGQRDNVPYETLARAHELRVSTAEASLRIADDPSLSGDAKRTALKELAQATRTKLLSTLGPATGPTYVENNRWINYLEAGRPFTVNPDGSLTTRSIAVPVSRPAPKG